MNGISCDKTQVLGHNHPYTKSIGNILSEMLYSLTKDLNLLNGLWCNKYSITCNYEIGGLFTTTKVQKLLFDGYTEPTILSYLNLKYKKYLHFSCVENSISNCDIESYQCNAAGMYLNIKNITTGNYSINNYVIKYHNTSSDEYFTPRYYITTYGELLWPYSINNITSNYAKEKIYNLTNINNYNYNNSMNYTNNMSEQIIDFINPIWAMHPGLNYNDESFQKYYQCQSRLYSGEINLFNNCNTILTTGRLHSNQTLQIIEHKGNKTINHFIKNSKQEITVKGTSEKFLYNYFLWEGFKTFPYTYNLETFGKYYNLLTFPNYYDKLNNLIFQFNQITLPYSFQKDLSIQFPIPITFKDINSSNGISFPVRRFLESTETWDNLRSLGVPTDSFGMNYTIPYGMASIERMTGIPFYVGTPHDYGNEIWGGLEYEQISGFDSNQISQQSFLDYDPITGIALN